VLVHHLGDGGDPQARCGQQHDPDLPFLVSQCGSQPDPRGLHHLQRPGGGSLL
jgi:hypothetical protein